MGCCYARHIICDKFNLVDTEITDRDVTRFIESKEVKNYIWPFKNIVVEGGSSNGTVTLGAYKVLEMIGITHQLTGYAGSSSGSIFAAFASVKISADNIERAFIDVDMNKFKDDSFGIIRDMNRLLDQFGFYKGDYIEEWVESVLYNETKIKYITFYQIYELYGSELHITRVNLSKSRTEYLNHRSAPNMCVSRAVRQSTSIPFVFKAPYTSEGDIVIDGGFGDPYPIDVFDTTIPEDHPILRQYKKGYNDKTIGFKIMGANEHRDNIIDKSDRKITNIGEYTHALITFATLSIERIKADNHGYWERTVSLTSPGRAIDDFDVSRHDKITDIISGTRDTVLALGRFMDTGHF
jgi:NTE family protein